MHCCAHPLCSAICVLLPLPFHEPALPLSPLSLLQTIDKCTRACLPCLSKKEVQTFYASKVPKALDILLFKAGAINRTYTVPCEATFRAMALSIGRLTKIAASATLPAAEAAAAAIGGATAATAAAASSPAALDPSSIATLLEPLQMLGTLLSPFSDFMKGSELKKKEQISLLTFKPRSDVSAGQVGRDAGAGAEYAPVLVPLDSYKHHSML